MTNEIKLIIRPFEMGTEKEAALKPLEEAAEAYAAWQELDKCGSPEKCPSCEVNDICCGSRPLADELADTIQASCNLATRYGIDLQAAMQRCEKRNRSRGRYGDANTNGIRESSVGDTAIRRWMDSDSGGNNSPTCACDRSGVADSDGNRDAHYKTMKTPEEMSAAELYEMLRLLVPDDKWIDNFCFTDKWCFKFHECDDCVLEILDLLKAAHEREVASIEYEKSYYKEKVEAYERDYDDAMRRITDLAHERDGLRNRLAELSDAGITELHRLLRETVGEAKNITDNARVYIEKQQRSKDEHCGSRGSVWRNHGGDCGAQCAREHLLPAEPPAQEMSEREKVVERLKLTRLQLAGDSFAMLSKIGYAITSVYEPWTNANCIALCDKLVELLSTPGLDYCKTCELLESDDGE